MAAKLILIATLIVAPFASAKYLVSNIWKKNFIYNLTMTFKKVEANLLFILKSTIIVMIFCTLRSHLIMIFIILIGWSSGFRVILALRFWIWIFLSIWIRIFPSRIGLSVLFWIFPSRIWIILAIIFRIFPTRIGLSLRLWIWIWFWIILAIIFRIFPSRIGLSLLFWIFPSRILLSLRLWLCWLRRCR